MVHCFTISISYTEVTELLKRIFSRIRIFKQLKNKVNEELWPKKAKKKLHLHLNNCNERKRSPSAHFVNFLSWEFYCLKDFLSYCCLKIQTQIFNGYWIISKLLEIEGMCLRKSFEYFYSLYKNSLVSFISGAVIMSYVCNLLFFQLRLWGFLI